MLSFLPLDVMDGIWDLIGSVSEGFLTYSSINKTASYEMCHITTCPVLAQQTVVIKIARNPPFLVPLFLKKTWRYMYCHSPVVVHSDGSDGVVV